jgi:hypothetical protein
VFYFPCKALTRRPISFASLLLDLGLAPLFFPRLTLLRQPPSTTAASSATDCSLMCHDASLKRGISSRANVAPGMSLRIYASLRPPRRSSPSTATTSSRPPPASPPRARPRCHAPLHLLSHHRQPLGWPPVIDPLRLSRVIVDGSHR